MCALAVLGQQSVCWLQDLNVDAYGVECKVNNAYKVAAKWSVSNMVLVNTWCHYICTYGESLLQRCDVTVMTLADLWGKLPLYIIDGTPGDSVFEG